MLKINSKQPIKRLAAALSATVIWALSVSFLGVSATAEGSSDSAYDAGKAYYNSDYNYLNDESSVFQSVTWEEAVYLFQQEGNYLILLGGSWCPNTTAVIDYINEAAKAAGVETIYNLDFRLDGASGDSHIRETNGSDKAGAAYNYLYGELVTRYLTNLNDWVEYTVDSESALTYTNANGVDITVPKAQVPFLFLYNKDNAVNHAGESAEGEKYPIVYGFEKMVYRDANGGKTLFTSSQTQDGTTEVTDYSAQLNDAIFGHIRSENIKLSSFTDADYIRLAYNEKSGESIFENGEKINIQTVTYRQLEWLLRQNGNYLILFGGSWCGNTQAVIDIINDYAVENNLTVYNFDTKLDGGYAKKYWGYSEDVHIRDSNNVFANRYVDIVKEYLDNIETEYTIDSGNFVFYQTDPADESSQVIANKLQVPYFFAYNHDCVDENGHDTPILGYVEKMYVLDESREDYIGNENNYEDYTTAALSVIGAYRSEGAVETAATAAPQAIVDNDPVINGNVDPTDSAQSAANDTTKIIVAVVGVAAVVGVVIFLAVGKNRSNNNGGGCC
ncbi:MAG: hypothetical protein NC084_08660 [Bacteroides sp.]|nr:hypothetical protein [Eubacterium sp.]MCM1418215.1 hypothetical protein [Roseburia sp.]MCM1462766.1 hypothetical protein [Bacteroides sp.]